MARLAIVAGVIIGVMSPPLSGGTLLGCLLIIVGGHFWIKKANGR